MSSIRDLLKTKITYEKESINGEIGSILSYDVSFLTRIGWALPLRGTVFNWSVLEGTLVSILIATVCAVFKCKTETTDDHHCVPLPVGMTNITLLTVTSFIVGLFSNSLLQRWWALRFHINGHTGANNEAIILLSTAVANSSKARQSPTQALIGKQACYAILRYLNLGNNLVVMNAQKVFDYDSLHLRGVLTAEERDMIKGMSGSPNIAYCWAQSKVQMLAHAGFLGEFPNGPGPSNLSSIQVALGNARSNCIAVGVYIDTQLPYPFVQIVCYVVHACLIQVTFVCSGTIGLGFELEDYGNVFTGYLTLVLFVSVMRALLILYDVLSNPLGDDAADFPWSTYLLGAEKGMGALLNNVFDLTLPPSIQANIAGADFKTESSAGETMRKLNFKKNGSAGTAASTANSTANSTATAAAAVMVMDGEGEMNEAEEKDWVLERFDPNGQSVKEEGVARSGIVSVSAGSPVTIDAPRAWSGKSKRITPEML